MELKIKIRLLVENHVLSVQLRDKNRFVTMTDAKERA
jgi:hypothetical protein